MSIGFGLIIGALAIGVEDVTFTPESVGYTAFPPRQVGYAFALNWGITYLFLFPVIGLMLVGVIQDVPHVMSELERLQVLRGAPSSGGADAIVANWKTGTMTRHVFVGLCIGFSFLYGPGQWYTNNLLRLQQGPTAVPDLWDWDWGLKCIMPEHQANCATWANATFDLAAFLAQFFYLALLLAFLVYMLDFRQALLSKDTASRLMPALKLSDRRRGFGVFEPMLTKMLIVVLTSFIVAYCLRIQNLYLRSDAASVWAFAKEDVFLGIGKSGDGVKAFIQSATSNLFDIGGPAGSQTYLVAVGMMFLFTVTAWLVLGTVGAAAGRARTNACAYYAQPNARPLFGLTLAEEQNRVDSMTIWPLGYMRVNRLLMWTSLALVSLIFYRVGLLVLGASLGVLVVTGSTALKNMIEGAGKSGT